MSSSVSRVVRSRRAWLVGCTVIALAAVTGAVPVAQRLGSSASAQGAISTTTWYNVVNRTSGSCADATNWGTADGTAVQQWACAVDQPNQEWQFQPTSSGYYDVLNRNASSEDEAWDVAGGASATAPGAKVQTWDYVGGTNQQWEAVPLGNGYYNFVARNSGLCLDTPGASTANGVQLQQYTCNGTGAQAFELVAPGGAAATTTTGPAISVAATTTAGSGTSYGGFPSGFWGSTSSIPVPSAGVELDFVNATNGEYPDSEVYWDLNGTEYSVAQMPYYNVTSCSACRIYFHLGSPNSRYSDFIEFNSGASSFNGDTSRVDAFGLPLAVHLHNSDGSGSTVGEDYSVFDESRPALFQQFESSVPAAFQQLATVDAPYSIPAPDDVAAFQPGGADAGYMTSYAASVGVSATTQQIFGCSSTALSASPDECAALNRGVARLPQSEWSDTALYYQNAPCNYYAKFWHSVAVNGLAYGFPYDDDMGQSSDISSSDPQYVQVAIGW
jgi:hypothetical protein